jgi:hypothetical protein
MPDGDPSGGGSPAAKLARKAGGGGPATKLDCTPVASLLQWPTSHKRTRYGF